MPVHQISVVPASKETTAQSSRRSRDKSKEREVAKGPGRSGSRSSDISKASSTTQGAVLNGASPTSAAPSRHDICRRDGSGQVTPGMPVSHGPDSAPSGRRQVKRRHRRRRESGGGCGGGVGGGGGGGGGTGSGMLGCTGDCSDPSRRPCPHRQSDSSSEDERRRRETRSWSREKARRRRSGSRGVRPRDGLELRPLQQADDGLKENRAAKGRKRASVKREEPDSKAVGGRGGEDEQPITKTYEEGGPGDPNMAVPTEHKKDAGSANQNGAAQNLCSDDELEVCRICHCEGDEECPLITPCRCTGSLRFVHQACLHQWIKSSDTRCCELCKYDFIMETHLKPLRKWEKLQMSTSERRKIFCSVTFHVVAVLCVVWSLYILVGRTAEELRHGANSALLRLSLLDAAAALEWPFWTKLSVVAAGFAGGLIFLYIQCKVYLQLWRRLKAFNRIIFVKNCPDSARPNRSAHINGRRDAPPAIPQTQPQIQPQAPVEVAPV